MKEKIRKRSVWKRMIPGYLTLEATYIFVTSLSVILFVISVGIYKYEESFLVLESCYELERSVQLEESTAEYIELQAGKGIARRQIDRKLQMGIWGFKTATINIEIEKNETDPALMLRLAKRWTGTEEDEN